MKREKGYQKNFSKGNKSVLDKNIRIKKAKKTFSVIDDFLSSRNVNMHNLNCVDIGGSAGFNAKELSKHVKKVFVIDIDENALKFGKNNNPSKNIKYMVGDAMNLPFKENSVDIIICNQVYEHVPSHKKLVSEIYRILRPRGICYFGAGNKYRIMEQHYNLPLFLQSG